MRLLFITTIITALWLLPRQLVGQIYSVCTPADAPSVALGEANAAYRGIFAFENNPALLSEVSGVSVFYHTRYFDYLPFTSDFHMFEVGAVTSFPFGTVGFSYKRFNMGEFIYTSSTGPEEIGRSLFRDFTFSLSYGVKLGSGFSAGISFKVFDVGHKLISGTIPDMSTTPAYVFDGGLLYSTAGLLLIDRFSLGMSLQNFGSDQITEERPTNFPPFRFSTRLPRYARVGFSYSIDTDIISFALLGEYRNILNSKQFFSQLDGTWGTGLELGILKVAYLRAGAIVPKTTSFFGHKGKLNSRYGFGVVLPIHSVIPVVPVDIRIDYSVLSLVEVYSFFPLSKKKISALSIAASIPNGIF